MALFHFSRNTAASGFTEEPDDNLYWEDMQYTRDFNERSKLARLERGPRAFADFDESKICSGSANRLNRSFPRIAANKAWNFNEQEYNGPLYGKHAVDAFSQLYGFDFEKFFEMTECLYAVCHNTHRSEYFDHEKGLYVAFTTAHAAEGDCRAKYCAEKILHTRGFFTKLFALLDSRGMEKVLQLIRDVYWGTRNYYEEVPAEYHDNPFVHYQTPVVQSLYAPFFGNTAFENWTEEVRPFALEMDKVLLEAATARAMHPHKDPVTVVLDAFELIDRSMLGVQSKSSRQFGAVSIERLAFVLDGIRQGLEMAEQAIKKQRVSRGFAVVAAAHPRLGGDCALHRLPPDVLREIELLSGGGVFLMYGSKSKSYKSGVCTDVVLEHEIRAFANAASVDPDDYCLLVVLRIIASFAQIEKEKAFEVVLGAGCGKNDNFSDARLMTSGDVDWKTIEGLLHGDEYADADHMSGFWNGLFRLIEFEDEAPVSEDVQQYILKTEKGIQASVPQNVSVIDAVRIAANRATGRNVGWSNICKTFLLINVVQDDPVCALTAFYSLVAEGGDMNVEMSGGAQQRNVGMSVARYLMGFRHSVAEHQETVTTLLSTNLVVNMKEMKNVMLTAEEMRERALQTALNEFRQRQRPSLTEQCMEGGEKKLDLERFIKAVVHCPVLAKNISKANVVTVEITPIIQVITAAQNIGDPCNALKEFKSVCVDSFVPFNVMRAVVSWSVIMKLYLAAYQRAKVRNECWRRVIQRCIPSLNMHACHNEVLQALTEFVGKHELAADDIFGIVLCISGDGTCDGSVSGRVSMYSVVSNAEQDRARKGCVFAICLGLRKAAVLEIHGIARAEDLHLFLKEELKKNVSSKKVEALTYALCKIVPQIIPDIVRATKGNQKCTLYILLELLLPVLDYDKAVCRMPVQCNEMGLKCSSTDFSELLIELSSDMDEIIGVLDHALGIDGTLL
eukprot:3937395-Rhodomonas_salina.4